MGEHTKRWWLDLLLTEENGVTRAEVELDTGDTRLTAHGEARLHPGEPNVPEIGDELATARALANLGRQLIHTTDADLESLLGEPAQIGY